MTLQEKLIMVLYKTSSANYASELLEKVTDNFAIEFMKWTHDLRDCEKDTIEYNYWLNISEEELLVMFKKEKGL